MKKQILLAGTSMLVASAAFAADLPARGVAPSAPASAVNWGGLYVGAFAGAAIYTPNVAGGAASETYVGSYDNSTPARALLGGTIGYNWQVGALVLGLEGDLAGALGGGYSSNLGVAGDYATGGRLNWVATARGRVGYSVEKALVYLTAGYAGVSTQDGYNEDYGAVTVRNFHNGIAFGGGLEYAIGNNLSLKLEALQIVTASATSQAVDPEPDLKNIRSNPTISTVKAGLNYHF